MSTKRPGRPRRPNPDKAAAIWYESLGGLEPLEILAHAGEAKKVFNEYVRDAELLAVQQLRDQGTSWQQIGDIFNISKQSAWERFGKELNQLVWGGAAETSEPEDPTPEAAEGDYLDDEDDPLEDGADTDYDEQVDAPQWADDDLAPPAADSYDPDGNTYESAAAPEQATALY